MEHLADTLQSVLEDGQIPGLSLCVRVDGEVVFSHALGMARRDPPRPVTPDQPFDLASVTKVLVGTTVAASLVDEGRLDPDAPLPDDFGLDGRITLRHLLQHSSGLPAWAPLYEKVDGAWGTSRARRGILEGARVGCQAPPGTREVYSDLGFLVLTDLLERAGSAPLDVLFQQRIAGPLGIADLRFGWPEAAATEDCPVRGHVVCGTVHDLNCAAMGGVSAHAGLFGTAEAVAALGDAILQAMDGRPSPLPGPTLRAFAQSRGPGSHRMGFDGLSEGYTSTGRHFPPDTVGHLGYTGTSLWMSPSRHTVVALLTNRVHPRDDKAPIRAARPVIHDAVSRALGWDRNG